MRSSACVWTYLLSVVLLNYPHLIFMARMGPHCMWHVRAGRWALTACVAMLVITSCLGSALAQTAAAASSSASAPSAAPLQTLIDPALFTGAIAAVPVTVVGYHM